MNLINNKIKQFAAGNWGCNQFVKKETRILDSFFSEVPKYRARKKHPRLKIDFEASYYGCPFCGEILPVIKGRIFWFRNRAEECSKCGARVLKESCPACKYDAWFKDGIYKHGRTFLNCGFVGRKKVIATL